MKKLIFVFALMGMMTMAGCSSDSSDNNSDSPDMSLGVDLPAGE